VGAQDEAILKCNSFLMSHQLLRYCTISQRCMESKGLLPCSQEPSTSPYPKPDESYPYHPIQILWFILITSSHLHPGLPNGPPKSYMHSSSTPRPYILCPSSPPWFHHSNYIWFHTEFDRLCGLVVRVLGYRSGGPGSIPSTTRKKSNGSGTGSTQPREYNWGATW
jgi:hypothetical protein